MKDIQRILVPIDFSLTAEKAFRFAVTIAKEQNARIILMHIYTPVEDVQVGTKDDRKKYKTQTEAILLKKLERLRKKVTLNTPQVSVTLFVNKIPVIKNILEFSERNKIDLIIMGTQGAAGLKKTIIGSISSKIVEKTNISVLLIPEKFELKQIKHIVFASNYQSSDKKALSLLMTFAKPFNSKITMLHLISAYSIVSDKEKEKNLFDTYAYSLQRRFSDHKLKFQLKETDSVTGTLENLDKEIPYDMVAMVRRKKSFYEKFFLGSFTKNMAYITRKPLLVVPEDD